MGHAAGIPRVTIWGVTISEALVHGPDIANNQERRQISVETSTPDARAFVGAFLGSATLAKTDYTLTSREVRAIVDDQPLAGLTLPMSELLPDVVQDLWQLSHVTASYVARAAAGAVLLRLRASSKTIRSEADCNRRRAFPASFLAQVFLAVSSRFVQARGDRHLFVQGVRALLVSAVLAAVAGAVVGSLEGGPILFNGFKNPLNSFAISAVIGITAGLADVDDTGRRYLIGVAAAVQLAVFPVWLGSAFVIGMPSHTEVYPRLLSFAIDLISITGFAVAAYATTGCPGDSSRISLP